MVITFRKTDFERTWKWQDIDGTPVNVDNATCRFVIMRSFDIPAVIIDCNEENFIRILPDAFFKLRIPAENFDLVPGDYFFVFIVSHIKDGKPRIKVLEAKHLHVRPSIDILPKTPEPEPDPEPDPDPEDPGYGV